MVSDFVITDDMISCFKCCISMRDYNPFFERYRIFIYSYLDFSTSVHLNDPICLVITQNLKNLVQYCEKFDHRYPGEFVKGCYGDRGIMETIKNNIKYAIMNMNWDLFYQEYVPYIDHIIDAAREQKIIYVSVEYSKYRYPNFSSRGLQFQGQYVEFRRVSTPERGHPQKSKNSGEMMAGIRPISVGTEPNSQCQPNCADCCSQKTLRQSYPSNVCSDRKNDSSTNCSYGYPSLKSDYRCPQKAICGKTSRPSQPEDHTLANRGESGYHSGKASEVYADKGEAYNSVHGTKSQKYNLPTPSGHSSSFNRHQYENMSAIPENQLEHCNHLDGNQPSVKHTSPFIHPTFDCCCDACRTPEEPRSPSPCRADHKYLSNGASPHSEPFRSLSNSPMKHDHNGKEHDRSTQSLTPVREQYSSIPNGVPVHQSSVQIHQYDTVPDQSDLQKLEEELPVKQIDIGSQNSPSVASNGHQETTARVVSSFANESDGRLSLKSDPLHPSRSMTQSDARLADGITNACDQQEKGDAPPFEHSGSQYAPPPTLNDHQDTYKNFGTSTFTGSESLCKDYSLCQENTISKPEALEVSSDLHQELHEDQSLRHFEQPESQMSSIVHNRSEPEPTPGWADDAFEELRSPVSEENEESEKYDNEFLTYTAELDAINEQAEEAIQKGEHVREELRAQKEHQFGNSKPHNISLESEEEDNSSFVRHLEELRARQRAELEEKREERRRRREQLEDEMRKVRNESRARFEMFMKCIILRQRFEDQEQHWKDWIRNCRSHIASLHRYFSIFEDTCRLVLKEKNQADDQDLKDFQSEKNQFHGILIQTYNELEADFEQLNSLQQYYTEALFLRILMKCIADVASEISKVVGLVVELDVDKKSFENLEENLAKLRTDMIYSTSKLRQICQFDDTARKYLHVEFPRLDNSSTHEVN